jgi:ubiquitin-protein ligase
MSYDLPSQSLIGAGMGSSASPSPSTTSSTPVAPVMVSKETIKRLIRDVKYMRNQPLKDQGIYYIHDESNILKGYGLLIGPKDTPYANGYYLFEFNFPVDYPHSPPLVNYKTNDGKTRFHPNLYRNGKVCLSILNTWPGEQWSGCQTINSILLTLYSIFTEEPFLHEPGITKSYVDFHSYHELIRYRNITYAMTDVFKTTYAKSMCPELYEIMKADFITHYSERYNYILDASAKYCEYLKKKYLDIHETHTIKCSLYEFNMPIQYESAIDKMMNIQEYLMK